MSLDYEMFEEKVTVLVAKDETTGAVLAYDCFAKGPSDDWVVKQFVRDLEEWGRRDIRLQTCGEPAMHSSRRSPRTARARLCSATLLLTTLSRTGGRRRLSRM